MVTLESEPKVASKPVLFEEAARIRFLEFARSEEASWAENGVDLSGSIRRMAQASPEGRITSEIVEAEIDRLRGLWFESNLCVGVDQ